MHSLRRLAGLYGVQTAYFDVHHRRCQASPEALLYSLRALGAPVDRFEDIRDAVRHRRDELSAQPLDPVLVAWDGTPAHWTLRLPAVEAAGVLRCECRLETGEVEAWSLRLEDLPRNRCRRSAAAATQP